MSAFQSLISPRMRFRHCVVVISDANVTTRGIGLIGTRSTPAAELSRVEWWDILDHSPTITLFTGMYLLATCSQPPGAAHKSIQHRAVSRKEYFLFNCINLNAERARYPCSLRENKSFTEKRGHLATDLLCEFVVFVKTVLSCLFLYHGRDERDRKFSQGFFPNQQAQ